MTTFVTPPGGSGAIPGTPLVGEDRGAFAGDGVAPGAIATSDGSAASPLTTPRATFKVSRTQQITRAAIEAIDGVGTDGGDLLASIFGVAVGTASDEVQPVGVMGFAKTAATTATPNADACGVYGLGRANGVGATGSGLGGNFAGRRDVTTAGCVGIEVQAQNYTVTDGTYNASGNSRTKGIALSANGNADVGVGLVVGNPFGRQFEVGIGFPATVTGGKTGGVKTNSIRDDSTSVTSILLNGVHSGYGIDFQGGTFTLGAIRIPNNTVVKGRNAANGGDISLFRVSASDELLFEASNTRFTTSIIVSGGSNFTFSGTTGTKIGTNTTGKLAFFNATPVVQPSGTPAAATDLTTVVALANSLRTNLITLGLVA